MERNIALIYVEIISTENISRNDLNFV